MSGTALIRNLKVRTSLAGVLLMFVLLLLAGAGVGLFSMRANNQTLNQVAHMHDMQGALYETVDRFKSARIYLAQGAELVLQDQVDKMAEPVHAPPGDNLASRRGGAIGESIAKARKAVVESRDRYAAFLGLVAGEAHPVFARIQEAYAALISGGVEPLFGLLERRDVDGYAAHQGGAGERLQQAFDEVVAEFDAYQQQYITATLQREEQYYHYVVLLVSLGIAGALVLALLVYGFLERVVLRPLRQAGTHFDRIACGDLTQRVDEISRNEIGALYNAVRRMQDALAGIVTEVRHGVESIQHGAYDIHTGNLELSTRTEQQAAALQQTAASMEQLSSTVRQNTDNAEQADQLAMQASQVAAKGGKAVGQVVGIMENISANSGKIADIVSVIDGIAFQTNILALNAAVEAARAGEQGKGFAVVAAEVRSLAQRSAQAAREIKDLIDGSLATIRQGATEAGQAGSVMGELVAAVDGVTTLMREISLASREQADGISQVNQAVAQMDSVVQQNAGLVNQAAASAGSLQSQSDRLAAAVAVFKLDNRLSSALPVDGEQARWRAPQGNL